MVAWVVAISTTDQPVIGGDPHPHLQGEGVSPPLFCAVRPGPCHFAPSRPSKSGAGTPAGEGGDAPVVAQHIEGGCIEQEVTARQRGKPQPTGYRARSRAAVSPSGVSGRSVDPVCWPALLQSVSQWQTSTTKAHITCAERKFAVDKTVATASRIVKRLLKGSPSSRRPEPRQLAWSHGHSWQPSLKNFPIKIQTA